MDEYFYITKGTGTYYINKEKFELQPGDFLKIPANTNHYVIADKKQKLEMVYFGIALEKQ